ncbi:MAG: adenylyltransferase/cytidyltransferase family protein [Candidatus Giovannonibacteria bacterium]|nr:MAG: adenylyltransferase/cytidyltransferase family protein [Candidatus Giovannonibacteria bacterium]
MAKKRKKRVYTYGVFDLFHSGHVKLLREAKALGDHLIVGLFTDDVAESFKRKPAITLKHRIEVLKHCVYVDEVVVQDELKPDKNILLHKPHILAKGPGAGWDKSNKIMPGEETMLSIGGSVVRLDYHDGISTSDLIKRIKKS